MHEYAMDQLARDRRRELERQGDQARLAASAKGRRAGTIVPDPASRAAGAAGAHPRPVGSRTTRRMITLMARRMTSPVLVGRDAAVGALVAALATAREGAPRHVLIAGDAGMGKTRLLSRLREIAEAEGSRVLLGGCVGVGDAGLPFAPYTEILRGLVAREGISGFSAIAGRATHDLAHLVPALGSDASTPSQELWAQTRLHEALLDLFTRLADRSPLVIGLEDLHWADPATLAATSFLLRATRDMRILLIGTYRVDEVVRTHPLRPWLAEVSRADAVERIDLGPLSESDLAELVRNIDGTEPTRQVTADLYRRTDGNPFFVEEILACPDYEHEAIPSSLRDVLLARVDRLSLPARGLLDVAAVGGQEVEHELLIRVADLADGASAPHLRELVDASLLVPASIDERDGYAFRHALLREAVLDTLLPTESRRLHSAYAEALAASDTGAGLSAPRLVELAHHWREARDPRALAASIEAGDAARASLAFDAASREYDNALRLWDPRLLGTIALDHVGLLERAAVSAYLASDIGAPSTLRREALAELGPDTRPLDPLASPRAAGTSILGLGRVPPVGRGVRGGASGRTGRRSGGARTERCQASGRSTCSSPGTAARCPCSRRPSSWRGRSARVASRGMPSTRSARRSPAPAGSMRRWPRSTSRSRSRSSSGCPTTSAAPT